jgi:soluble lytic murein transglycosylase-like protein
MKRHYIYISIRFMVFLLLYFALLPGNLQGEIYSYVDKDGVLYFSNAPTSTRYKYLAPEETEDVSIRYPNNHDKFDYIIREAASEHGLRFELLKAIIHVESAFDPYAVSSSGALGLMQLMPQNIEALNVSNPFDPHENVMAGARYFKGLLKRYNSDLPLTLAAYNAGPGAVDQYKTIPPYPETQNFVERVLKYYALLRNNLP